MGLCALSVQLNAGRSQIRFCSSARKYAVNLSVLFFFLLLLHEPFDYQRKVVCFPQLLSHCPHVENCITVIDITRLKFWSRSRYLDLVLSWCKNTASIGLYLPSVVSCMASVISSWPCIARGVTNFGRTSYCKILFKVIPIILLPRSSCVPWQCRGRCSY